MISPETIAALKQIDQADTLTALAAIQERVTADGLRLAYGELLTRDVPEEERPKLFSLDELFDYAGHVPPMLVDQLLPEKSLILLTGKPKLGKSFAAWQIIEDVEQGRPVFGKFPVNRRGPVVCLSMEDGVNEIVKRLIARGRRKGENRSLYVYPRRIILSTQEGIATLESMIQALPEQDREPVLVVIDTARESLGIKDQNDAAQVGDALRPIREFARANCTVLLVAHNRKQAADNDGDEIAGSGAFASSVDGWLSGTHGEKLANGNRRVEMKAVGRGDMHNEFTIEMDTETLEFRVVTQVEIMAENDARDFVRRSQKYDRIIGAINSYTEGYATVAQIAPKIGLSIEGARSQVMAAVNDGFIEETGHVVKPLGGGRPSPTYRVSPIPSEWPK